MAQEDSFGTEAEHFGSEVNSMTREHLTPLRQAVAGGKDNGRTRENDLVIALDPKVYRRDGREYRPGDTLPDGRVVLSVDDRIPTLTKRAREGEE